MVFLLLISPLHNECSGAKGDYFEDALESFFCSKWQQGNTNAHVLEEYGGWAVYQFSENSRHDLRYCGDFKDLLPRVCPHLL